MSVVAERRGPQSTALSKTFTKFNTRLVMPNGGFEQRVLIKPTGGEPAVN